MESEADRNVRMEENLAPAPAAWQRAGEGGAGGGAPAWFEDGQFQQALDSLQDAPSQRGGRAHQNARVLGRVINKSDEDDELRNVAVHRLCELLRPADILRACNLQEESMAREGLTGEDVVRHLRRATQKWNGEQMRQRTTALSRLAAWLEQQKSGLSVGDNISEVLMTKYFADVHEAACEKAASANGKGDGTRAAHGAWQALCFLQRNWGLAFNAIACKVQIPYKNSVRGARKLRAPSRPFSMGMMGLLEEYIERADICECYRHLACVLLVYGIGGQRFCQLQQHEVYAQRDDVVYGQVDCKKHPTKREPGPFWLVLISLIREGEHRCMETWHASMRDLEDLAEAGGEQARFLARSFSRVEGMRKFGNGSIPYASFLRHMRRVIQEACPDMDPKVAQTFGAHSARHFLPNVMRGRRESDWAMTVAGQWDGWAPAKQQAECLWKPDAVAQACAARLRKMPERYAGLQLAVDTVAVLRRNLLAVRDFIRENGGARAVFAKEKFSADGLSDDLGFDRLSKEQPER
jgi:hypothetical protein